MVFFSKNKKVIYGVILCGLFIFCLLFFLYLLKSHDIQKRIELYVKAKGGNYTSISKEIDIATRAICWGKSMKECINNITYNTYRIYAFDQDEKPSFFKNFLLQIYVYLGGLSAKGDSYESRLNKSLERYLNYTQIANYVGFFQASEHIFGKNLKDATLREILLLDTIAHSSRVGNFYILYLGETSKNQCFSSNQQIYVSLEIFLKDESISCLEYNDTYITKGLFLRHILKRKKESGSNMIDEEIDSIILGLINCIKKQCISGI